MNTENNIFFIVDEYEKGQESSYTDEIQSFIHDLNTNKNKNTNTQINNNLKTNKNSQLLNDYDEFTYFKKKQIYSFDDATYYSQEYNVKELLKICDYYNITKNIKSTKLTKKNDIIEFIIHYESLPENFDVVYKRHRLWAYIEELNAHSFMKKYLLWK